MPLLSGPANTRCSVYRFESLILSDFTSRLGRGAPGTGLRSPETGSQNPRYRASAVVGDCTSRTWNRRMPRKLRAIRQRRGNAGSHESAWWRRQLGSNPSPHQNSLLTGKRTGNFAESDVPKRFFRLIGQPIQRLAAQFPKQWNRDFFGVNRDFSAKNTEFSRIGEFGNSRAKTPKQRIRPRINILTIRAAAGFTRSCTTATG